MNESLERSFLITSTEVDVFGNCLPFGVFEFFSGFGHRACGIDRSGPGILDGGIWCDLDVGTSLVSNSASA